MILQVTRVVYASRKYIISDAVENPTNSGCFMKSFDLYYKAILRGVTMNLCKEWVQSKASCNMQRLHV
jgi:hypothetical protein